MPRPYFRIFLLLPPLLAMAVPCPAAETPLTVMSYNVWKSWTQVEDGFRKGVESIRASGADIAGLQEANPELADRIARELGWFRAGNSPGSTQIVSRFSITESLGMERLVGARVRVAAEPVREVVVFNCHLDYRFYGPYAAMKEGATAETVMAEENRSERAVQMKEMLKFMKASLDHADNAPVFLTGDFNCPSHLDWTAATTSLHGNIGPVSWSPSTQVVAAGLSDSFRIVHPDPAKEPGFTWSSIHKAEEPQDRIDFTYHKGKAVTVKSSRVFTTNVEATVGPWGAAENLSTIRKNTWPSDHAAVVTTYSLE